MSMKKNFQSAMLAALGLSTVGIAARTAKAQTAPPSDAFIACMTHNGPITGAPFTTPGELWNSPVWSITPQGVHGEATSINGKAHVTADGDAQGLGSIRIVEPTGIIALEVGPNGFHLDNNDATLDKKFKAMSPQEQSTFLTKTKIALEESIAATINPIEQRCEAPAIAPGSGGKVNGSSLRYPLNAPGVPDGEQISGVVATNGNPTIVQILEPGGKTIRFYVPDDVLNSNSPAGSYALETAAINYARMNQNSPRGGIVWDYEDVSGRVMVKLPGKPVEVEINNYGNLRAEWGEQVHPGKQYGFGGIIIHHLNSPDVMTWLQPGFKKAIVVDNQGVQVDYNGGKKTMDVDLDTFATFKGNNIPRNDTLAQDILDAAQAIRLAEADASWFGKKFHVGSGEKLFATEELIRRNAEKYRLNLDLN